MYRDGCEAVCSSDEVTIKWEGMDCRKGSEKEIE